MSGHYLRSSKRSNDMNYSNAGDDDENNCNEDDEQEENLVDEEEEGIENEEINEESRNLGSIYDKDEIDRSHHRNIDYADLTRRSNLIANEFERNYSKPIYDRFNANDDDLHRDSQFKRRSSKKIKFSADEKHDYYLIKLMFLLMLILTPFAFIFKGIILDKMLNIPFSSSSSSLSEENYLDYKLFSNELENNIKPKYNNFMTEKNWRLIESGVKEKFKYNDILKDKWPNEPIVYLFLSSFEKMNLTRELIYDLQITLSSIYQEKMIDESFNIRKLTNENELNEQINYVFGNRNLHTIFIDGIESYSGNDIMSLHCFTDNENSIYLNVFVFLSAYSNKNFNLNEINNYDHLANQLLLHSWINTIDESQISALLSRLTSRVIIVMDKLSAR